MWPFLGHFGLKIPFFQTTIIRITIVVTITTSIAIAGVSIVGNHVTLRINTWPKMILMAFLVLQAIGGLFASKETIPIITNNITIAFDLAII